MESLQLEALQFFLNNDRNALTKYTGQEMEYLRSVSRSLRLDDDGRVVDRKTSLKLATPEDIARALHRLHWSKPEHVKDIETLVTCARKKGLFVPMHLGGMAAGVKELVSRKTMFSFRFFFFFKFEFLDLDFCVIVTNALSSTIQPGTLSVGHLAQNAKEACARNLAISSVATKWTGCRL